MGRIAKTIVFLVGFLSGVFAYLIAKPPVVALFFVFLASLACLVLFRKSKVGLLFLLVLGLSAGFGRARLSERTVGPGQIDFHNGRKIQFEAVVREADVRRDQAKYTVSIESRIGDRIGGQLGVSNTEKIEGDVLITLDKYPQYHYGDRVRVSGLLEAPGEFEGFSYGNYLSRFDIYSVMRRPFVQRIGTGEGSFFWRAMSYFQNGFNERINRLFPEPFASFEAGLLIGARKGIPPDIMEQFTVTGLSHIIAISGFNITIILSCALWALKGLPRKIGFWVAVASIVLFTLFVGASPSVTRAAIMGILGLVALNHGRQSNIHLTVLFAAFFMTLWNPKILWWDVGFQLSFGAVLGLLYVAPLFGPWLRRLPEAFGIREALTMTLSAQVMALPLIVFHFGRLSLIAPLANLLVCFAIPPAMFFGFAAVASSFFIESLGLVFGYVTSGILAYILGSVRLLSSVPYASVDFSVSEIWLVLGYYAALAVFLIRFRPLNPKPISTPPLCRVDNID